MTSRRAVIGYYVHHHGAGHAARFRAIAAASEQRLVPISERNDLGGLVLPSDVPAAEPADPTAGGALHWAPLDPSTATPRVKHLVDWLDRVRPAGVVVDVSVEIALACRLAGVATVYVRLHGPRRDGAHRMAYSSATGLLAPYPAELETDRAPEVIDKTRYVGFIHPVDAGPSTSDDPGHGVDITIPTARDAVVLWGRGGGHLRGGVVDAVAGAIDGTVYCAGSEIFEPGDGPSAWNVVELGWVPDTALLLTGRPLVVSSAGSSCVAAAARARCPLVVVAVPRPFEEQHDHAAALAAAGVAVCAPTTADPAVWRRAVVASRTAASSWDRLRPHLDGAPAAAAAIADWLAP